MDPFAIVIIAVIVIVVLWVLALGRYAPGSSLESIGLRTGPEIVERRAALEAEDLAEMLAARNARRRARGEPEVNADDYEMQVMADINAQRIKDQAAAEARRNEGEADRELDDLLELTNARRRARGLPERTREDVKREFG